MPRPDTPTERGSLQLWQVALDDGVEIKSTVRGQFERDDCRHQLCDTAELNAGMESYGDLCRADGAARRGERSRSMLRQDNRSAGRGPLTHYVR